MNESHHKFFSADSIKLETLEQDSPIVSTNKTSVQKKKKKKEKSNWRLPKKTKLKIFK